MKEFKGYVEDIQDALILIEASVNGYLDQKKARLTFTEKMQIRSGTTFILNENDTNIKRWSDGISWTPSRLMDGFFVYQQQSTLPYDSHDAEIVKTDVDKHQVLHKKSIVIVAPNNHKFHLFNYYRPMDVLNNKLILPKASSLTNIPGLLDELQKYTYKVQPKPKRKRIPLPSRMVINHRRTTLPDIDLNSKNNNEEERLSLPSIGEAISKELPSNTAPNPNIFSIDRYHLDKINEFIQL